MRPPGHVPCGRSALRALPLSIAERLNTMTTLMQASRQWATRPADERFLSLHEMAAQMRDLRDRSRAVVESTRKIELLPDDADMMYRGLQLGIGTGPLAGVAMAPTHFSFG